MLPPELLDLIFGFACNDDAPTTRALASVSHAFYFSSLPFTYRSVALHNTFQTKMFTERLQSQPHRASLVKHLFIAETATIIDCLALRLTLESLLKFVSPTLLTLSLLITTSDKRVEGVFQPAFEISFPCLTAFSTCGDHIIPRSLDMPNLRHFHTAGLTKRNPAGFFAPLTQSCPHLSHIRVSMASQQNLTCATSAAFGLLDTPMSLEQMHLETTWDFTELGCSGRSTHISYPSLPRDLISLTIKPAAPPMITWPGCATIIYFQYMKELEDLALACPPGKLHLLRAFKRDMWEVECYDVPQAKKDWLDVAMGGMGAWSADEIGN